MAPGQVSRRGRTAMAVIGDLLVYLWPAGQTGIKVRVILALLLLLAAKLATVYAPLLYKTVIDSLDIGGDRLSVALPLGLILAYGLARVAGQICAELRDRVFARVSQRATRAIALRTFEHLHRLSLRFHLERQTGGLSRAIERGVNGIGTLLRFMLFSILPTLVEIVLVCGILWALFNVWYSLVTLVAIVAYVAFTLLVTEWRLKFRRAMNESDSQANTRAIDSLLNFETVKYFGNEGYESRRYDQALRRHETAAVRSLETLALVNIGQSLIIAAGATAIMIMAARDVAADRMSLGDFVLVNTWLLQLYLPLNFLGFVYREIRQSLTDMESMFGLLHQPADITDKPAAAPLALRHGRVRFDRVSFGYDPRRPILKEVSFEIPPGTTLAIVGPTGAGKSTLSRLLFRFYDVTGGAITIDGQDIRDVPQAELRAALGIVPQDTVLFNDTILYNIRYGRPDATPAEVVAAAQLARIHDFIASTPDGYDTRVGERGLKLSGGEKQRVAIARTILKQPRIMLFDEATSALDIHTEKEIQASLRDVSADRTTLVIAHRLSTVTDADTIIVLEDGRIVEQGDHAALLARGQAYAALWAEQQRTRPTA